MDVGIEVLRRAADRAVGSTIDLADVRMDAREKAIVTIRSIEREVVVVLGGSTLRCCADLVVIGVPFRGARLRGKHLDESLPNDGRAVLVLSEHGQIVMACRDLENYDGVDIRSKVVPATNDDLRAEDLVEIVRNYARVLARHTERVEASSVRYSEVIDLAARLAKVLDR